MERLFYFFSTSNFQYFLAIDNNKGYYLDKNLFSKCVIKYPVTPGITSVNIEQQLRTVLEIWQVSPVKIKLTADIQEYEMNIGSEF